MKLKEIEKAAILYVESLSYDPYMGRGEKIKNAFIKGSEFCSKEQKGNVLSSETSYTIGKFQCFLDEKTGNLKIIVHENGESIKITPKSDNSIVVNSAPTFFKNKPR